MIPPFSRQSLFGVGGLVIGLVVGGFGGYLLAGSTRQSAAGPDTNPLREATHTPAEPSFHAGQASETRPVESSSSAGSSSEPVASAATSAGAPTQAARERTVADVVGLARRQKAATKAELDALRAKLMSGGDQVWPPSDYRTLHDFIYDSATSVDALALLAQTPSPEGPEFLYRIWSSSTRRTPVTELADGLLMTREVREHAAPALKVLLDLRQAKSCDQNLAVLERIIEAGDRRAIAVLAKLQSQRGCGPQGQDDCYPCLRTGDRLEMALKAAQKRPPPSVR
jgi:hypothetical protein